ncbi:MAG TPA: class I SAM-dependent methyltransferase [Kofleriaceae bacterium]
MPARIHEYSKRAVRERERFLQAFHDAQPGITSRGFARSGSYERLAARVPAGCVLDLGCGDGTLLRLLGPDAVGIDIAREDIVRAKRTGTGGGGTGGGGTGGGARTGPGAGPAVLRARAQQLPFADRSFDAAICHLAFMLFDDVECVVDELARVLRPDARFVALLGGGPTADGHDAFHRFASLLPRGDGFGVGDKRASSESGWHELFAGWRDISFERWPLDLGGTFDEVWTFLSSSYQLRDVDRERIRVELRAAFPGERVPCMVATYCATATR